MGLSPYPRCIAILGMGIVLAQAGQPSGRPDSAEAMPKAYVRWAVPNDAFEEFLRETRSFEDSSHFRQGEIASGTGEFALALSHNLAVDLPSGGSLRDGLLAQRSRIFARLWPLPAAPVIGGMPEPETGRMPRGPVFDWGAGAEHDRGLDRTGARFPDAGPGSDEENREWKYTAYAKAYWDARFGENALPLAISASADRSSLGAGASYAVALDAGMPGKLQGLNLSLSAGLDPSWDRVYRGYSGFAATKAWRYAGAGAEIETGYSGQWDWAWKRLQDKAWIGLGRGFGPEPESGFRASLEFAADRQASRTEWFTLPVMDGDSAVPSAAGEKALTLVAPQSSASVSLSLAYAFPLPAGLGARAEAGHALVLYPEYAWDRIDWPRAEDPPSGDSTGIALIRNGGFYYPALLTERDGAFRETRGTAPVERVKSRRVDNRMSLAFGVVRDLPGGYSLSAGSSLDFAWTNLPHDAPVDFRPWQWGLALNVSRAAGR